MAQAPRPITAAWTPSMSGEPTQRAAPAASVPMAWEPNWAMVAPVTARITSSPATRESRLSRAGIEKAMMVPMHSP